MLFWGRDVMETTFLLFLNTMQGFFEASRYGKCVREMQDCQRLAPLRGYEVPMRVLLLWFITNMLLVSIQYVDVLCPVLIVVIVGWMAVLISAALFKSAVLWRYYKLNKLLRTLRGDNSTVYGQQMGEIPTKMDRIIQWNRRKAPRTEKVQRGSSRPSKGEKKKKSRRKLNVKKFKVYQPQMGSQTLSDAFARLANIRNIPIDDKILSRIEDLGALFLALKDCVTLTSFLSILFLYLKTHYSKSVANTVSEFISTQFEVEYDAQTGEFGVQVEKDKPSWLRLLKEVQQNWTLVVRNEGFQKISNVLSICLALGLCDASQLEFRAGGMKLFSIGALPKHATAVDLVDASFETIAFFVEGGYACFEQKSIRPLLYGDMDNCEFEECFATCLRCNEYARCGNLDKLENMSENDYEALLVKCIEKAQYIKQTCKGTVERTIIGRKIDILRQWQASFRQTRVQGGLREAPYSIGIYGGTAVGKSSISSILMVVTLLHAGYSAADDRLLYLNESDKYMSNMRSFINGIFLDDIGNTKAEFVERPPSALMIQLVNNVRTYANMAEADMKGKISIEPKVVITTKNRKDTCATIFSNEPASITRRDRITITATVKPEFATHDMLDADKVSAAFPEGVPLIPNLWNFHVERSYPIPSKVKGGPASVGWEMVEDEYGVPMKSVSLPSLIRWIAQDSTKFYKHQKELVEKNSNLDKKIRLCPKCNLPTPDVCLCEEIEEGVPKLDSRCPSGYCTTCGVYHPEDTVDGASESSVWENRSEWEDVPDDILLRTCTIVPEDKVFDQQIGEIFVAAMLPKWRVLDSLWRRRCSYWLAECENKTAELILGRLEWLETSPWVYWTNYIPKEWLKKEWMIHLIWWTERSKLERRVRRAYLAHIAWIWGILFCAGFHNAWWLVFLICPFAGLAGVVTYEKNRLYNEVVLHNEAMPLVFKMYRDRHIKWLTGVCVVIAAVYAVVQVYKVIKVMPVAQGNIAPTSQQDLDERDTEINPWAGMFISSMPCTEKAKTTTPDRLEKMVTANMCFMSTSFYDETEKRTRYFESDAFFPKSNIVLVPRHMWKSPEIRARFTRHDPTKIGGNFECFLSRENSVDIPGVDLSIVWVPNGGDWKDLTEYLPLERFADVPGRLIYKQSGGSILRSKLFMKVGKIHTKAADFFGAKYDLSFNTFDGLCMAPIITETKGPLIGGFHLGGHGGQKDGCCGLLLKDKLDEAIDKLKKKTNVVLSTSSGTLPTKVYDVQYYQGDSVHPKSPVNYLPHDTNCKYYGQVTGRSSYYSEVIPTIITKHVEDVCGVPQQWGRPKFRQGWPWQASLQHSTRPSIGVESSLLSRASRDYVTSFLGALKKFPDLIEQIRPLTEMENVCGIDGRRFIDKLVPQTSIGYPLSGPKSQYLVLLDPEEHPEQQCPAELDQRFWKHAYEMEEKFLKGERVYSIFKACLKDEPTDLSKDKVRVFQGAPIALQLLVRKYYLPIARTLSMLPLVSECAVGINPHGPEWNQLSEHITKYGKDRILAGDYSKYDLRMPAQVMFAAFRIMMDIGTECGYTERDRTIMSGIATEICYPLMAYNGDLIQHYGSNPSGHNLTVYVNSIVNALLMRCAYYHIYGRVESLPPFKEVCALITYGDDVKGSVHQDYPDFNHISVAQFLGDRDMKFTMPDKESDPTPYMKDEEADFLKRSSIYNPDIGLTMGALSEDSIFKSLHSVLKSGSITVEQQSMQNIDGALREWFFHGRDTYEKRREQMIEIAKRADITHGCQVIHESYDDRLMTWREKYT